MGNTVLRIVITMVITTSVLTVLLLLVTGRELSVDEVLGTLAGALAGALIVAPVILVAKRRRRNTAMSEPHSQGYATSHKALSLHISRMGVW